ncbi:hypothetical protein Tco_0266870 [Tanacetum coccineum]
MTTLTFFDTYNMVAFLEKPAESDGFHEIIDFMNANQIHYALTFNPTIYTSCIEQFWATAKAKTINGESQLQALVDKKKVIITETSIRSDLHLEDAGGIDCLPTATIFEELEKMSYIKVQVFYYFQPSTSKPQKKQSRRKQKMTTAVPYPSDSTADVPNEESVPTHSNDPLLSGEDRLKLTELMDILYKVGVTRRVDLSNDESLGAQEDASNQGWSIEDIDKDAEVFLVDETQGRSDDAEIFDTNVLFGNEVFAKNDMIEKDQDVIPKEVSTAAPSTTVVAVKSSHNITLTIPKAKGITFRDADERTTRTPTSVSSLSIKDKGKAKMDEPEVPLKKKDQIAFDEEMARNLGSALLS